MVDAVKHVILVKSVKGGVGKSTVSAQLALSLWHSGYKVILSRSSVILCIFFLFCTLFQQVGLLDIDLCGPSVPYLMNLEGNDGEYAHQISEKRTMIQ